VRLVTRIAVLWLCLAALAGTALAGCGGCDDLQQELRERTERLRAQVERLRDRVREALDELQQAVPRASQTQPATRGRTEPGTIDRFLTDVLGSVDAYWTQTLEAAGRPAPRVGYDWIPPGARVATACGAVADDAAAFYCPRDDVIYISEVFAARLWQGVSTDFPGEQAGYGHAVGDFGLAYVVAHEYAHNVQQELGLFTLPTQGGSRPFELQADCMAGLWGNAVYRQGKLQPGDVEEAMDTALAVGDFDYANAQHHGTPEERRAAWLLGYESGDPSRCQRYLPA
jgi:predicted metalloprotease